MPRYFICFAYKGTRYHGWQIQDNANSVQAELNKGLSTLLRMPMETTGAGRTDTGVHAKIMFAHFDSLPITDLSKLCHQLNSILPEDIAIHYLLEVKSDAHARFDATSRTYEYHLYHKKDPFLCGFAYFHKQELNVELMNEAAGALKDYHDFSSFSKSNTQVFTNNCEVMKAQWEKKQDQLIFTIQANRFLRNMVRAIVGTLLEVGEGKMSLQDFRNVVEGKSRSMAGTSVPPEGLYLTDIQYPYINK
jgi:tRNA pseudouridine38-40 synthase